MSTQIVTLPTQPDTANRRRRSKIFRLPKTVRDQLNQMLDDGVPYLDIKAKLGDDAPDITLDNISDWKSEGGYSDWLEENRWRDALRIRLETLSEPVTDIDPARLSLTGLQMSLAQVCEQLRDLGPGVRKEQFENNADKYLRMLNTLSRLTKTMLALQQHRQPAAPVSPAAPAPLKQENPDREFNQTERDAWLDRADDLFNFKSAARLRREMLRNNGPLIQPTPQSATDAPPPAMGSCPDNASPGPLVSSMQTQGSTVENLPVPPPSLPSIENQESKIAIPPAPEPPTPALEPLPAPVENQNPTPKDSPASETKNQNSTIKTMKPSASTSPAPLTEHCHYCRANLPPLLPDGRRPQSTCKLCGNRLYPPGTLFDHCQFCGAPQPLPGNQRVDDFCYRCHRILPPIGQRFVTQCPTCGLPAPIDNAGNRTSPICSDCRTPLPLLQPAEPPSPVPWKPEDLET